MLAVASLINACAPYETETNELPLVVAPNAESVCGEPSAHPRRGPGAAPAGNGAAAQAGGAAQRFPARPPGGARRGPGRHPGGWPLSPAFVLPPSLA